MDPLRPVCLPALSFEDAPSVMRTGTNSTSSEEVTVYHLTDNERFQLKRDKIPDDNAISIFERKAKGLFVVDEPYDVGRWVAKGYIRPFVVEMRVPRHAMRPERWHNEKFVDADFFDDVKILRIIPIDAFYRDTWGGEGLTEGSEGGGLDTDFYTREPLPFNKGGLFRRVDHSNLKRYSGDVRHESADWIFYYKDRVNNYARSVGKALPQEEDKGIEGSTDDSDIRASVSAVLRATASYLQGK